jgi:hypothetical protein
MRQPFLDDSSEPESLADLCQLVRYQLAMADELDRLQHIVAAGLLCSISARNPLGGAACPGGFRCDPMMAAAPSTNSGSCVFHLLGRLVRLTCGFFQELFSLMFDVKKSIVSLSWGFYPAAFHLVPGVKIVCDKACAFAFPLCLAPCQPLPSKDTLNNGKAVVLHHHDIVRLLGAIPRILYRLFGFI